MARSGLHGPHGLYGPHGQVRTALRLGDRKLLFCLVTESGRPKQRIESGLGACRGQGQGTGDRDRDRDRDRGRDGGRSRSSGSGRSSGRCKKRDSSRKKHATATLCYGQIRAISAMYAVNGASPMLLVWYLCSRSIHCPANSRFSSRAAHIVSCSLPTLSRTLRA